jgi:hypothetical protein
MRNSCAQERLRLAYPIAGRLALAWLLAGPLNPVQMIWMIGLKLEGEFLPSSIFWFIGFPASFGMVICLLVLVRRATRSVASLYRLTLNVWFWMSLTAILYVVLPVSSGGADVALYVFGMGLLVAVIFGLPAALVAAWIIRLVVFRTNLALPRAPASMP